MKWKIIVTSKSKETQKSNFFTNKVDISFFTQNKMARRGHSWSGPTDFFFLNENWSDFTQNSLTEHNPKRWRKNRNMAPNIPLKFRFWALAAMFLDIFKVLEASAADFMKVFESSPRYGPWAVGNTDFQNGRFYLVKFRVAKYLQYKAVSVTNWWWGLNPIISQVIWAIGHIWGLTLLRTPLLPLSVTAC